MNSDKEGKIDEIINRFVSNSAAKIDATYINQLIEIKKLALEEQKNTREHELKLQEIQLEKEEARLKDRQSKFPASFLSNPTTPAITAGVVGLIVVFIQGHSNLQLEQLKFQFNLIAKATESRDLNTRNNSLKFLIDLGLIKDTELVSKLDKSISEGKVPQLIISVPNRSSLPTVIKYTGSSGCFIAAYSHERENSSYSVGNDIYVMGQVRVEGTYQGGICQPKGYEGKEISGLDHFKEMFDKELPNFCRNKSCWAGGDTL